MLEKNTGDIKQRRDTLQTYLHQTCPFALKKGRLRQPFLAIKCKPPADAGNISDIARYADAQARARHVISIADGTTFR